MKMIVIRVDYQGVVDIYDTIKEFQSRFSDKFSSYVTTSHSTVNLNVDDIEQISDSLSLPITEVRKQTIHRFQSNTFGTDELTLDITKYYSVLKINCTEYTNIDPYLSFFSDFCQLLSDLNQYLFPKRLGLRKIGSNIYTETENIFNDFESKYFDFDFSETGFSAIKYRHIDVIQKDEESPVVNYIRAFEQGTYIDEEGDVPKYIDAFQVTLDLDAYLDSDKLKKIEFKINNSYNVLRKINDEDLFNLFKMSVTEDFLNRNKANSDEK